MCRIMIILCQWDFNEQTEKLVILCFVDRAAWYDPCK